VALQVILSALRCQKLVSKGGDAGGSVATTIIQAIVVTRVFTIFRILNNLIGKRRKYRQHVTLHGGRWRDGRIVVL